MATATKATTENRTVRASQPKAKKPDRVRDADWAALDQLRQSGDSLMKSHEAEHDALARQVSVSVQIERWIVDQLCAHRQRHDALVTAFGQARDALRAATERHHGVMEKVEARAAKSRAARRV